MKDEAALPGGPGIDDQPPPTLATLAAQLDELAGRVYVLERERRWHPEDSLIERRAEWTRQVDHAVLHYRRGPHYTFTPPDLRDVA